MPQATQHALHFAKYLDMLSEVCGHASHFMSRLLFKSSGRLHEKPWFCTCDVDKIAHGKGQYMVKLDAI